MHGSQTLTLLLLIIYAAGGCVACYFVLDEECTNLHKLFSVISVVLVGFAMLIFRLLRGQRTRTVKYIHMAIHTTALLFFIIGFIQSVGLSYIEEVHPIPGYVVLFMWALQYIIAIFVFTYLYDSPRIRLNFAPFHDILGIWVFLCLVGVCLNANVDTRSATYPLHNRVFNITTYCTFMIVIVVVLSPYFEWELVGPI